MRKIFKVIFGLVILAVVVVGLYVSYVYLQYNRLPDSMQLTVDNNQTSQVQTNKTYKIMTYNIGYASYPADYTFFMDGGKEVRARSKKAVNLALSQDLALINEVNPDFINLQEVDLKGNRSLNIDEVKYFQDNLISYSNVFGQNYNSAYLFYPITKPIGKAKSGIMTFSKNKIDESKRYSLPIETNFNKFFDLDRAFTVDEYHLSNGKTLYIYNTHMSAFIKDQKIQKQQLTKLFDSMKEKVETGNYVVCGGDYNHALAGEAHPELTWMKEFPVSELDKRIRVEAPTNAPTVRSNGVPYSSSALTGTIDGFLVSNNIESIKTETIVNDFESSDHHPVVMSFKLK